jgi:sarcosine oxidase subunit beta
MSGRTWDVIVVGAGSVGVPAALALAEHRLRVLVLDKEQSVGQGQNKAAIGGVRATHSDPAKITVCLESLRLLSRWEEQTGHHIGWQTGGYCYPAYREEDERTLKGLLLQQHAYGLNIGWLEAEDLRKLVPDINPEGLLGGTFSPGDGNCSPLLLITSYYRLAKKRGVAFRFGEEVSGFIRSRTGRVTGVRTTCDTYACDGVVIAAGADVRELLAAMNVPVEVEPDSHEGGITEPVQPFLGPLVVDVRPGPGSRNAYFYQNHLGRVLFCVTPEPLMPGKNRACTSGFLPMASRRLLDLVPRLRHLRVRRTWRGLYPMTPDGAPIVDAVESAPGLVVAVGMCGQGFMIAPGLARQLVSLVLTGSMDLPADVSALWKLGRSYASEEVLR